METKKCGKEGKEAVKKEEEMKRGKMKRGERGRNKEAKENWCGDSATWWS